MVQVPEHIERLIVEAAKSSRPLTLTAPEVKDLAEALDVGFDPLVIDEPAQVRSDPCR